MARFTRSSASENPPSSPKLSPGSSKKRTRAKSPHDEQPPGKHPTQSPAIPSVGDVPIKAEQSRKILDILQAFVVTALYLYLLLLFLCLRTDPQGLLDRVFSVNESPVSLQTLLQDSSNYSLSDLRVRVLLVGLTTNSKLAIYSLLWNVSFQYHSEILDRVRPNQLHSNKLSVILHCPFLIRLLSSLSTFQATSKHLFQTSLLTHNHLRHIYIESLVMHLSSIFHPVTTGLH